MSQVGPQMGIEVHNPNRIELQDDRTQSYTSVVKKAINPSVSFAIWQECLPALCHYTCNEQGFVIGQMYGGPEGTSQIVNIAADIHD